jgi:hypothetical protein
MGYSSKQGLQNNYAGNVPQQTNYGYSGSGVKKNSAVPMLMAGGAGVVAGGLIGAGGYYAYSRMSKKNYQGDYRDRSWCRPNQAPERTMLCFDCQQEYGNLNQCESLDDCYGGGAACSYTMPGDTLRDDILLSGFVPDQFKSPFKITITNITGNDYKEADICPGTDAIPNQIGASWRKAVSVEQSLFLTLTEMTALDVNAQGNVIASARHASIGLVHLLLLVFALGRFFGRRV